jgi:ABC-type glutathione transport system ATPase component
LLAAFVSVRQGLDLVRHPFDALIEIFPIGHKVSNDVARTVPHISLRDLTLRYRSKRADVLAVDRVSLELPPRSFTSVIGPSGCGKSMRVCGL